MKKVKIIGAGSTSPPVIVILEILLLLLKEAVKGLSNALTSASYRVLRFVP